MNSPATTKTPASPTTPTRTHPIVFYDGVCGLCNRSVKWIVKRDHQRRFRFAPLQGETAKQHLPPLGNDPDQWSVVLLDDEGLHERSDAALRIARGLGGLWGMLGSLLLLIPRPCRDWGYRQIAKRRYRWFGKHEACQIPTPEERELILP